MEEMSFWHVPNLTEVKTCSSIALNQFKDVGLHVHVGAMNMGQCKVRWIIPNSVSPFQCDFTRKERTTTTKQETEIWICTPLTNAHLTTSWTLSQSREIKLSSTHVVFTSSIISGIQCSKCLTCFHLATDISWYSSKGDDKNDRLEVTSLLHQEIIVWEEWICG